MALQLTDQADNIKTKLDRLKIQIEVVLGSEFPNLDARAGVIDLQTRVQKYISRFNYIKTYSAAVRSALLRDCNYNLAFITELLGFIIRSITPRNLFELYYPLIKVSRVLVNDDVKLIMSSDWQFSPFTYPYGLDELPRYILIGLPASESENALIFPAAGHELGHNIWRANSEREPMNERMENAIYEAFEANKSALGETYPQARNASVRGDMTVQPIARKCLTFAMRQLEELFCDLVGMRLFGSSYLFAFDYILSPTILGSRTGEYPSTRYRAKTLTKYAARMGIYIDGYESRFIEEKMPDSKQSEFLIRMADVAVDTLTDDIFEATSRLVSNKISGVLNANKEEFASKCFRAGVPCVREASIGDLINAAWTVYNDKSALLALRGRGVSAIPLLTDLVIKSAELNEYKEL